MDGVCTRFARSYAAARRKFILAAELAGHEVTTHAHTLRGPGGEELANDTVWIGDPDARRVLVVTAGTHGPELFCGSGAQIDAAFDGAMPRIRRCFVLAAGDDPVTGRLTFGMRIAGSGRVSAVNLSGPAAVTAGECGECLREAARNISFPSFDGPEMVARYPITLE